MFVRSVSAAALVAVALGAAPALAQSAGTRAVDPARVLAGGNRHGFAGRTANLAAIMGEAGQAPPMRVPTRPQHPRGLRREADALAGLR